VEQLGGCGAVTVPEQEAKLSLGYPIVLLHSTEHTI